MRKSLAATALLCVAVQANCKGPSPRVLSFAPSMDYPVGIFPHGVAQGDLNGDGFADIAVANSGTNTIAKLYGVGDGAFRIGDSIAAGSGVVQLELVDLNHDDKLDMIATNGMSTSIDIFLGNGDGTHQSPVNYAVGAPGAIPFRTIVGKFNGDEHPDLAVASSVSNDVAILLGSGAGSFGAARSHSLGLGMDPNCIASGDLNGDGILDLATDNFASRDISVLYGNGDGTFKDAVSLPSSGEQQAVAIADLNGDAMLDIMTSSTATNGVNVYLNDGAATPTFKMKQVVVGGGPYGVDVSDFDLDGLPDMVVVNNHDSEIGILLGRGDGTFSAPSPFKVGAEPLYLRVADFNGDGLPDIAVTNFGDNTVSVLINTSK